MSLRQTIGECVVIGLTVGLIAVVHVSRTIDQHTNAMFRADSITTPPANYDSNYFVGKIATEGLIDLAHKVRCSFASSLDCRVIGAYKRSLKESPEKDKRQYLNLDVG